MAFSFGASSPATSTFSGFGFGNSTPAFGGSLFGASSAGAASGTPWDDIGPNGQSNLLQIEKLVGQQRDGCRRLDAGDAQLQGRPQSQSQPSKSSQQRHALKQGMQAEARPLQHALQLLNNKVATDSQAALHCEERDMELMQDVELGIRAFQRCVLWIHAHQAGHQLSAADRERLSTPPILPSPFLCHSIPHLQEKAEEYSKLVAELERVLPASALQQAGAANGSSGPKESAQMLETALLNMHDYFVHVAARVASLQEATEAARESHLRNKRQAGDSSNPFEAADQREAAAAAEAARAATNMPSASSSATGAAPQGASGPAPLALGAPGQPSSSAPPSSQPSPLFSVSMSAATSTGGGFGGGFLFGQPASTPAQAASFGFGSNPAAAPAAGGLFGGISPASAPAGNFNQSGSRKSSTKRR
ncbi:hypothetical protein WJX84_001102 [Apatococcus fuscideae]|uniref:Nucleoporin p58/p45 n=1 Tax=Apatococcus fuscideae TaxID=2026836 RepID=A0AAW1T8Z2_9CHLO